ncbi:hypothetical protein BFJ72_g6562 [Fusarium proliferatum]|uniref:Uncharacterized protein n=1 Tax=Gibberella intermedia TaxID=948311 RepID=A0A420TE90_GIBIN|nr:hypothetical protein BFJ72_g6562 [Fusarium proliferatum]
MYRGTHRIMDLEGPPEEGNEAFGLYKLLLYKGRDNANPTYDDRHRFVYLAENKPREPLVGDCFVRLEEIHKRMKGTATEYTEDCARYNEREKLTRDRPLRSKLSPLQKVRAAQKEMKLRRDGNWTLRFRCWTVDGKECTESESRLRNRLFDDVFPANNKEDHLAVFKVWAGNSMFAWNLGDKLAAKDFFGRYWDAVIPEGSLNEIQNGFGIIVGAQWFQDRKNDQVGPLDYENPGHREIVREEVHIAVQRAINAPRLKFKPRLDIKNIFFDKELNPNPDDRATGWFDEGWRCLDGHPGGLYHIVVNKAVRDFLSLDTHKKPFWQEGYGYPQEKNAKDLNDNNLDLCRLEKTGPTTTAIDTNLLSNLVKKRNPTQDRCVATNGYSANLAMSDAFPEYYPVPALAKRQKVAEHVDMTHNFFPFNRESCLLFQSILDKSVEEKCWGWNCWDANRVVVDALLESMIVDGDKEEANKEEATEKLREATAGDREGVLSDQVLNDAVLNLV